MQQIIVNLTRNAIDACERGGNDANGGSFAGATVELDLGGLCTHELGHDLLLDLRRNSVAIIFNGENDAFVPRCCSQGDVWSVQA